MSIFTPHLYIGVGSTGAYFTLRETYLSSHTEVDSFHHFNLSQDADEALSKATFYSLQMGLPVHANKHTMREEMRTILRASKDEIEERNRREDERQARYIAQQQEHLVYLLNVLSTGRYAIGAYAGKLFEEATYAYIDWLVNIVEEKECSEILVAQAAAVVASVPHMLLPKPSKTGFAGIIDERITTEVTIVRNISVDTQYGTSYVVTMVGKDTLCYLSMGAFNPKVGEKLTIKGRIKSHDTYKEQDQTRLQRITIV